MEIQRRAVLHIGTEKTGSTTIQQVLAKCRPALIERGFAFPSSPSAADGAANHERLALYAMSGKDAGLAQKEAKFGGDPSTIEEWLPKNLGAELRALPDSVHTIVLSGEHCHSRLPSEEPIAHLKALLDRFFDDIRVIVYLRRQDEVAVSHYSTRVRNGQTEAGILPKLPQSSSYFDYAAMLDRWSAVYGKERLQPRLFGREHFADGDLVKDFLAACGVPAMPLPPESPSLNPSWQPAAQEFLRRYNERVKALGLERTSSPITRFLDMHYRGRGRVPLRAAAQRFYEAFRESNERVRQEHFPERKALFDEDFSRYPETQDPTAVSPKTLLDVALDVTVELSGALARRNQQAALRPKVKSAT